MISASQATPQHLPHSRLRVRPPEYYQRKKNLRHQSTWRAGVTIESFKTSSPASQPDKVDSKPPVLEMPKIKSLSGLFYHYFKALSRDKGLRSVLGAKMTNAAGDGLILGGALALTAVIGVSAPYVIAIGIPVLGLAEIVLFSIPYLKGSLRSDDGARSKGDEKEKSKYAIGSLTRSAYYDLSAGGMLLLGTIGAGFAGWGVGGLFTITVFVKSAQALGKGVEASSFSQLRWVYGRNKTRNMYRELRDSVSSLENLIVGLTYAVTTIGVVVGIWALAAAVPVVVPFVSIGLVVAGTCFAAYPKIQLARKVQKTFAEDELKKNSVSS